MNDDFKEELKDCYAEIERLSEANTQVWADNERLRAALRWIDEQRYVDRSTINQDNAFRKAVSLNERLVKIMDTARAALGEERT